MRPAPSAGSSATPATSASTPMTSSGISWTPPAGEALTQIRRSHAMTRAEVKDAIQNALPTPNVPDELVWEVLSECIAEQTGQQPRLVTLMESVQPPDAHARMRALLEASNTPRSDLKADDHVNPQETNRFLPDGVDIAAAIRSAAEDYKRQ